MSKNGISVQCVALCNTENKIKIKSMKEGKRFQMVLEMTSGVSTNDMGTIL